VTDFRRADGGRGPTGLTLAHELGRRGVRTALLERRPEPQFLPKMERCNARTMEIFRRVGLAEKIRAAGLPGWAPMDVFIVTALDRPPLLTLPYPSVDQARAEIAEAPNDGSQPCEPYQLVSQYTLEPLLKAEVERLPSVSVRFGRELVEFAEQPGGVTAVTRDAAGRTETVRGKYLVGCDGGASLVRKGLGIKLRGEGDLLRLSQALFRCDALKDLIPIGDGPGLGRHYHVADDRATFLIMQDSMVHWTLHSVTDDPEEMKRRFEAVVARPVDYEMLYCGPWRQNLLLADRYRSGRGT
jgi:2-polyprenyl-6-methoxyphenol hydroxylase and related FAD-dependent oxidoreductases